MAARYADVTPGDRRWFKRDTPAHPVVELSCAGGGPAMSAELRDLSTFGCRLGGDGVDDVGDHVRLSFGQRPPVTATVVWRDGGVLGCRFDKPIATTLMKALICGET